MKHFHEKPNQDWNLEIPGARPTNDIWMEFEIQRNIVMLLVLIYSTDHNHIFKCAKFCRDRLTIYETRALQILIEFRIRSKYR